MSRRVVIVLAVLTVCALAAVAAAGAVWLRSDHDRQQALGMQRQAADLASAYSWMSSGDCVRAAPALARAARPGFDAATAALAVQDQAVCRAYRTAAARSASGPAAPRVTGYLDVLLLDGVPQGMVSRVHQAIEVALTQRPEAGLVDAGLCRRFDDLVSTEALDPNRTSTALLRYLSACWKVVHAQDPALAATLLRAMRTSLAAGPAAGFTGPDYFTGSGPGSRLTLISAAEYELDIFLVGTSRAFSVRLDPCTRHCSPSDDEPCRTDATTTVNLPAGRYQFMVRNSDSDDELYGGSGGVWTLRSGQSEVCIT